MPFYGRAFSGVGYSADDGLKFTGIPEDFTISKGKKITRLVLLLKGREILSGFR